MFANLSLRSFIYDMIDDFCSPNETVKEIYAQYNIKKMLPLLESDLHWQWFPLVHFHLWKEMQRWTELVEKDNF